MRKPPAADAAAVSWLLLRTHICHSARKSSETAGVYILCTRVVYNIIFGDFFSLLVIFFSFTRNLRNLRSPTCT